MGIYRNLHEYDTVKVIGEKNAMDYMMSVFGSGWTYAGAGGLQTVSRKLVPIMSDPEYCLWSQITMNMWSIITIKNRKTYNAPSATRNARVGINAKGYKRIRKKAMRTIFI